MLEVKNVIFGLLIWFFETFAILTILFKIAEKYWKSEIGKLVTYAVIILLSNLLPFIYTGNYLFGFSTLFSFVSILFYFFRLVDSSLSSFDTINFSIFVTVVFAFLVMLAVALDDSSLKPIEGESQTYEARYKIASSYEQSGVIRIKGEENESSYYIILYEDTDEHGKTTIKLLQLSHSDIDIVYAVEKQENNFLVKYKIEQVSKSEDNSKETTNDTAYSYKLYLSPDFQINDIVPSLN